MMDALCLIEGCAKAAFSKRLCRTHYERMRRHGNPNVLLKALSPKGRPLEWIREHAGYAAEECLVWPFARFPDGRAHMNGQKPTRVMCEAAHGPAPSTRHQAAHSCGNGHHACINPKHLRWATSKENCADKIGHGTLLNGRRLPQAKLSDNDVRQIRSLHGTLLQREIAERFGVHLTCINGIIKGRSWRHVI